MRVTNERRRKDSCCASCLDNSNFDFAAVAAEANALGHAGQALAQMPQDAFTFTVDWWATLSEEQKGAVLAWASVEKLGAHRKGPGMCAAVASFAPALTSISKRACNEMMAAAGADIPCCKGSI